MKFEIEIPDEDVKGVDEDFLLYMIKSQISSKLNPSLTNKITVRKIGE